MQGIVNIDLRTYLKANRRIHGTLPTLPKQPPSVNGGNWTTAGQDWRVKVK